MSGGADGSWDGAGGGIFWMTGGATCGEPSGSDADEPDSGRGSVAGSHGSAGCAGSRSESDEYATSCTVGSDGA